MAKSTKIIAALGVAGMLGMIAMPTFAADTRGATDTVVVTVDTTCSITSGGTANQAAIENLTGAYYGNAYTGTALPGSIVDLNGSGEGNYAKTTYKVVCNDNKGYTVTAKATGLAGKGLTGNHSTINFKAPAEYDTAETNRAGEQDGAWTASVTGVGNASTDDYYTANAVADPDADAAAVIVTKKTASDSEGKEFEVTYKAFVGQSTQAGTYEGKVVYTLVPGTPAV